MNTSTQQSEIEALEHAFWKSLVDRDSSRFVGVPVVAVDSGCPSCFVFRVSCFV